MITIIMIVSFVIIAVITFLAIITTNKAYDYTHKVDPLPKEEEEVSVEPKDDSSKRN